MERERLANAAATGSYGAARRGAARSIAKAILCLMTLSGYTASVIDTGMGMQQRWNDTDRGGGTTARPDQN